MKRNCWSKARFSSFPKVAWWHNNIERIVCMRSCQKPSWDFTEGIHYNHHKQGPDEAALCLMAEPWWIDVVGVCLYICFSLWEKAVSTDSRVSLLAGKLGAEKGGHYFDNSKCEGKTVESLDLRCKGKLGLCWRKESCGILLSSIKTWMKLVDIFDDTFMSTSWLGSKLIRLV